MDQALRRMLSDRDDGAIDDAFFENGCCHFFAVDWREDDADIVEYCAKCLGLPSLRAEWRGESLVIIHDENETPVPLANDDGDRHVTISTLNELLQPEYEIRFLVCSHGSDTAGFAVLPTADWHSLENGFPQATAENFIRLRAIPSMFTELTDNQPPAAARARFQRMLERNRRR